MFDKYEHYSHSHSHSTEVTVKRAPTDESVRLLKEFEEKAMEKIVGRFEIKDNILDGMAVAVMEELTSDTVCLIIFNLNGKEHRCEIKIEYQDFLDKEKFGKLIYEKFSQAVVTELFKNSDKNWQYHLAKKLG